MEVKFLAIIQARMGSKRLPGKVLKKINGKSLIEILLYRLSKSKLIDKIIVSVPMSSRNNGLSKVVEGIGFEVFRGEENDVLGRYYQTANPYNPNAVIRITGDCPIIDPSLVDEVISLYNSSNVDYASNVNPPSFPDGLDIEVFSFLALKKAYEEASSQYEREHVTPFIRNNDTFPQINFYNRKDYSHYRWTVDEEEDFVVIKNIIKYYEYELNFSWKDVIKLRDQRPDLFLKNQHIKRNEGSLLNNRQKFKKRVKGYFKSFKGFI